MRRHLIGHLLQRLDRAVAQVGILAAKQWQQAPHNGRRFMNN
jgi:hypothetical protein